LSYTPNQITILSCKTVEDIDAVRTPTCWPYKPFFSRENHTNKFTSQSPSNITFLSTILPVYIRDRNLDEDTMQKRGFSIISKVLFQSSKWLYASAFFFWLFCCFASSPSQLQVNFLFLFFLYMYFQFLTNIPKCMQVWSFAVFLGFFCSKELAKG
jgi:hypothetical protein